jgi:hypothetical protein
MHENFNISENNIISVKLDMTLWYFFKKKTKEKKGMVSTYIHKIEDCVVVVQAIKN